MAAFLADRDPGKALPRDDAILEVEEISVPDAVRSPGVDDVGAVGGISVPDACGCLVRSTPTLLNKFLLLMT